MSEEETKQISASEKALAADPAALGLFAFAFTTFLLSSINAGLLPPTGVTIVASLAMMWGGISQMIAGAFEMRRGNTFGFTAFTSYGAFWLFYAFVVIFNATGLLPIDGPTLNAALIFWGIFSLLMWIPAMMANTTLNLTFLCLWIALILLGLGYGQLGGYFGLGAGFFAAYTGFAVVVNSVRPNTIPVGPGIGKKKVKRAPAAKPAAESVAKAAPAAEPAAKPALAAEPTAKSATEAEFEADFAPAAKPAAKPMAKPAPAAKPAAKPMAKPAPAAKPAAKPMAKPAPAAKPMPKPAAKPMAKPAPKPAMAPRPMIQDEEESSAIEEDSPKDEEEI